MNFWEIILVVWICVRVSCVGQEISENSSNRHTQILKEVLGNGNYDPKIPPNFDKADQPVDVTVQLFVLSIDSVDEASMDYSLTVYLRQRWLDDRLRFTHLIHHQGPGRHNNVTSSRSSSSSRRSRSSNGGRGSRNTSKDSHGVNGEQGEKLGYFDRLQLDVRQMDKVWIPDTYFINERKASIHTVTAPNKLMHILHNGTVFFSIRISLTLTCHMNLAKYPFDEQTCPLVLSSYGFTRDTIRYAWGSKDSAVKMKAGVELPTFAISHWSLPNCEEIADGSIGKYSCIELSVTLARNYGYYVAQVYLPSILVVILSWVNFWLDVDATPARISLGLLTVLTMTTMSVGARSDLPRVSYIKAIDLWMAMCLIFVFSGLLEFAFVNVTARVQKRRMTMREAVSLATAAAAEEGKTEKPGPSKRLISTRIQQARHLDKMARVIFPAVFVCFNIFYWCFYMI